MLYRMNLADIFFVNNCVLYNWTGNQKKLILLLWIDDVNRRLFEIKAQTSPQSMLIYDYS